MDGLIASATSFLAYIQKPSLILSAIMIAVGGYYLIFGGENAPKKAKKIVLGVIIGLVLVNGAIEFATSANENIKF